MANHISHAALPFPVKNARYTLLVPYLDSTGTPTDPTTPDTEISKDAGSYVDTAEEVTTITGSNGSGFITLTGAELDCSAAFVAAKVASGPKTTLFILNPRVLPVLYSGTASAGAAGTITLASDVPNITNLLVGCIVKTTGGTGGGGTGGANNQARVITAFNTSRVATVVPNWETTPDGTTTYEILLTEYSILRFSDLKMIYAVQSAAQGLSKSAQGIYFGSITGASPTTTTLIDTGLGAKNDNFYKDRLILFISGNQKYQHKFVTAYTGSTDTLTFGTLTGTPAQGDEYVLL